MEIIDKTKQVWISSTLQKDKATGYLINNLENTSKQHANHSFFHTIERELYSEFCKT